MLRTMLSLAIIGAALLAPAGGVPGDAGKAESGKPSAGNDPYAAYRRIFRRLDADADGDGNVTHAEAAGARRTFAEMDADGSGEVNIPEFLSTRRKWQVDVESKQRAPAPSAAFSRAGKAVAEDPRGARQ